MDKIANIEERKWYIKETVQNGWSSNMLKLQISGKVYERQALAEKITNDAGQLNFYLSAVDDLVKDKEDNATIGLLLCKEKNNFTAEYALKDINKPIGVSEYKLLEDMPEYLQSQLPRAEDIELHIKDIEEQEDDANNNKII